MPDLILAMIALLPAAVVMFVFTLVLPFLLKDLDVDASWIVTVVLIFWLLYLSPIYLYFGGYYD